MILPHNNRELARQYFEKLPSGDINNKFYEGQKYESPKSMWGKFVNSFNIREKLTTLQKFYPYQKVVRQTIVELNSDNQKYLTNSLLFTAASWTVIFNLARRGYVAPLLSQYGSFFNTHRLYRQYLYTLVGPLLYSHFALRKKYYTHVEHLWIVHANRLNNKQLEDPLYTYYPEDYNAPRRKVFVNTIFNEFGPGKQYEEEVEEDEEEEQQEDEE